MTATQTVYLYVTDTLADWEPGHAVAHIARPDWQKRPGRYEVRTIAATSRPVTTMGGVRIAPDTTFPQLVPSTAAMLILPGSQTWDRPDLHAEALAAARSFLDTGIPVAAICGATYGLALAGLLDDRDHTSNAPELLAMSGYAGAARFRTEPAVGDRGLITASGVMPVDFAAAIFAELDLYEPDVLAAWYGLYKTGDPEHWRVLAAA